MRTFRVEELAAAADVKVDTIRFYQGKGLLPPPRRVNRIAVYSEEHLARIRRIRELQEQGLTLAVIKKVLAGQSPSTVEALIHAIADQGGSATLTRAEVAKRSGVPEALLAAVESAGLLVPIRADGEAHYSDSDVEMARAGMEILGKGFPLHELLQLAITHARNVEETVDAAVDLFDRFVRRVGTTGADPETVADDFRRLLPAVTTLVAQHFQRTLLNRALERLREHGEHVALEATRAVLEAGRLEVKWK